jgi:Family of unknown function (DUF6200)
VQQLVVSEDMKMPAERTTTTEQREQRAPREQAETGRPPLVMVDLSKQQTSERIKRLRRGRGSLLKRIDEIVEELIQAGTVKAGAQPVVIVVREKPSMTWLFATDDAEDEDDEDDDDDDDED